MLGALPVREISLERNARLLLLSSQARPPSSKTSFQSTLLNFTASSVFLLLSTTPRPSPAPPCRPTSTQRIAPVVRVVDAVTERLPERPALGLQGAADLAEVVPRLRVLEPGFLEPVLAIRDRPRDDELRHADPAAAGHAVDLRVVVPAALLAADLLGHVAHVDERRLVEVRVIVRQDDDVRPRAALDRRRRPRLQVVLVDALDLDLDARLLAELHGLGLEESVGGRDEMRPLQQVQPGALRVCRRAAGGDDALDAAGGGAGGKGEKAAAADGSVHGMPP